MTDVSLGIPPRCNLRHIRTYAGPTKWRCSGLCIFNPLATQPLRLSRPRAEIECRASAGTLEND